MDIEDFNRKIYADVYTVDQVSINKNTDAKEYFNKLVAARLAYLRSHCRNKEVLDIGCGSGDYLIQIKDIITSGYGIDYTDKAIDAANAKIMGMPSLKLKFMKANARHLPFEDGVFDLVFSFSALAYMPALEEIIKEITRVLKADGMAILEIGNLNSLNTLVCEAYPEYAKTCHIKLSNLKKILKIARLRMVEGRVFGILPFWGKRPSWLKFLLHERWKEFFQHEIKGKMLDEWVSSLPILRNFAFRHLIVCQKI